MSDSNDNQNNLNAQGLALLRQPFPNHQISLLPKPHKKDAIKGNCDVCGKYHGLPATHLEYIGHASLTDRLLDADPTWHWEPLAIDEHGLPRFDKSGGLWIKLTVCGITRLGYGHAESSQYKDIGAREKEVIGDALRNAGMRFGAGLEMWHKGDLHLKEDDDGKTRNGQDIQKAKGTGKPAGGDQGAKRSDAKKPQSAILAPGPDKLDVDRGGKSADSTNNGGERSDISEAQLRRLFAIKNKMEWNDDSLKNVLMQAFGIDSTKKLTWPQYNDLTKFMELGLSPDEVIEKILVTKGGP